MPGFSNCRCAKFPAPAPLFYGKFRRDRQQKARTHGRPGLRLRKSIKSVAVGGHAPTTATPTGKFCGKLCARNEVTSARFAAKFCRRAAEPSAACGGCSEAEQGQRSQNASAVQGAPHDAGTATRTFQRGKRAELALASRSVAPFAACRVSRHAEAGGCPLGFGYSILPFGKPVKEPAQTL